jgi:hypothetical protein
MHRARRCKLGGVIALAEKFLCLTTALGLSREERISALGLARLLQFAWGSPTMSELMSSLPVTGLDGTLKRSKSQSIAHLKTGSLRDVAGIAGYVDAAKRQATYLGGSFKPRQRTSGARCVGFISRLDSFAKTLMW